DVLEDLLLPGRRERLGVLVVLDLADLGRDAGALVDELEDLQVELVDLGAQATEVSLHLGAGCMTGGLGLSRHGKSCPACAPRRPGPNLPEPATGVTEQDPSLCGSSISDAPPLPQARHHSPPTCHIDPPQSPLPLWRCHSGSSWKSRLGWG